MPLFHLVLIALIQGITEFLPISSSGHLILLPEITGMVDQGQIIDVAAHVGTLAAVILYFRSDVALALGGCLSLIRGQSDSDGARLALGLIIATIPVVIIGLILNLTGLDDAMRSIKVIGWTMLIFGIVLYWADQSGDQDRTAAGWSMKDAIVMGLWQALALIPGTSRSGITITGARRLGFARQDAARLSMLMSIPTILASGLLKGAQLAASGDAVVARDGAIVALLSFVSALVALTLMMRLLRSVSFTPYVVYRIILGPILLWIAYT